jgi:uncharacterized RDD family membrane protein YckC/DNA-directed RNA polymerase subunit M/transcription elongation factor TFIIS
MPIKVRCKECSTVLNVSDKAAGRAVKCKKCGARVSVPAAGGKSGSKSGAESAGRKRKKKRAAAPEPSFDEPSDADDMFGGLNLRNAEDSDQQVCPNCTELVDEEDVECPKCGVNISTGVLSETQRKKRARKGPPPEEFYSVIWPNGWAFVKKHWGFVFKTGFVWGFSLSMSILAAFTLNWIIETRTIELTESATGDGITISADGVFIDLSGDTDGDVEYDGVRYTKGSTRLRDGKLRLPSPRAGAIFSPPSYFWAFIFLIFTLGMGGWAWTLSSKIVALTMAGEKKIKRFNSDMYGNMTKGFTSIFWPIVLMYPFIWIPGAMALSGVAPIPCLITFVVLFLVPYFVFLPTAVVHMAQPYSYRAWLLSWMSKDLLNTLAPALYVAAIFTFTVLLVPLGIGIGLAVGWDQFANFYTGRIETAALGAISSYSAKEAMGSFNFIILRMPFLLIVSFLVCTTLCMILAIPSVFMMRVFGLFGLYFRPDLDLCAEQVPLAPAGFGPRVLAVQVDILVGGLIALAAAVAGTIVSAVVGHLYNSVTAEYMAFNVVLCGGTAIALAFYFARWESGSGRATLGKWTFGMLVLQDDDSPMPFKLAVKRFAMSLVSVLTLSGSFVMCFFRADHRALHDRVTKTKVVWRGDENL